MKPASISTPAPECTTFPVLSLLWASHWAFLTRLRAVVCNLGTNELLTIYHYGSSQPTWLIWPLDDGVAMRCATNDWSEEYIFPCVRTALLRIRRLSNAKKIKVDWAVARSLPPSYP